VRACVRVCVCMRALLSVWSSMDACVREYILHDMSIFQLCMPIL